MRGTVRGTTIKEMADWTNKVQVATNGKYVSVKSVLWKTGSTTSLTANGARRLAALLVAAAEEIEGKG